MTPAWPSALVFGAALRQAMAVGQATIHYIDLLAVARNSEVLLAGATLFVRSELYCPTTIIYFRRTSLQVKDILACMTPAWPSSSALSAVLRQAMAAGKIAQCDMLVLASVMHYTSAVCH